MDLQDEQIITLFFDVCRRNQRYHDRVSGSDDPSRDSITVSPFWTERELSASGNWRTFCTSALPPPASC